MSQELLIDRPQNSTPGTNNPLRDTLQSKKEEMNITSDFSSLGTIRFVFKQPEISDYLDHFNKTMKEHYSFLTDVGHGKSFLYAHAIDFSKLDLPIDEYSTFLTLGSKDAWDHLGPISKEEQDYYKKFL